MNIALGALEEMGGLGMYKQRYRLAQALLRLLRRRVACVRLAEKVALQAGRARYVAYRLHSDIMGTVAHAYQHQEVAVRGNRYLNQEEANVADMKHSLNI